MTYANRILFFSIPVNPWRKINECNFARSHFARREIGNKKRKHGDE